VVIIGGHLDSWIWDGRDRHGTGSMAVLCGGTRLQKLGVEAEANDPVCAVHRRRTGFGRIEAYVKAHQGELEISGVLVHDSGTGKVLTVGLMGNYAARETVDHRCTAGPGEGSRIGRADAAHGGWQ